VQAAEWLTDQLHLALSRSDLAVVHKAILAWRRGDLDTIAALNDWVTTTRETSELRQQTQQMGRSLVEWLRNRDLADERLAALAALQPTPTWPVAFALASAQTGASPRESLLAFAFGWAENMVQASLKAVPLGQNAGQRILAALSDAIPGAVDRAIAMTEGERQAFAPMLAILSAQHETHTPGSFAPDGTQRRDQGPRARHERIAATRRRHRRQRPRTHRAGRHLLSDAPMAV
jgi:urease accessory protein